MSRVHIRSDPHHFAGSASRDCRSGSRAGLISTKCVRYFFQKKQYTVQVFASWQKDPVPYLLTNGSGSGSRGPLTYGSGLGSVSAAPSSFAAVFCPYQQLRGVRGDRRHQAGGERQRHQTGSPDTTGELLHYLVRAGVSEPYYLNPDTNAGMLVNMDSGPDPGFWLTKNGRKKFQLTWSGSISMSTKCILRSRKFQNTLQNIGKLSKILNIMS